MSEVRVKRIIFQRKIRREQELESIKKYLEENGSATPEDIVNHLDITATKAGQLLSFLAKQGVISKKRIAYTETVYTLGEEEDA